MPRRLSAPRGNGEVLADPGFDEVPVLVEANRRLLDRSEARIGDLALRELRIQARKELQSPATAVAGLEPLIIGGHQPELSHPGVWVKNFALNGLARKLGGTPLHLIVDSDTAKSAALKVPMYQPDDPSSTALGTVPFDKITGTPTFEDHRLEDSELFDSFPHRLRTLSENWPFKPLAFEAWPKIDPVDWVAAGFTLLRQHYERAWGCHNLEGGVRGLSEMKSFRRFATHIVADLPRFRESYNEAIRNYRKVDRVRSRTHPAPELEPFEAPFWVLTPAGRRPLIIRPGEPLPEQIRPRALTLTLFARLILGDFFIHGIGGGKYDEATDAIIRDYFGIEPPAYQVVSATLHLPLPAFPSTEEDLEAARRRVRDLQWNPQRNVVPPSSDDPFVMRLVADRESLASTEPAANDHAARREWYRKLADLNEQLRHHVWKQVPPAKADLARVQEEIRANAVLRRRDYSWILYPESTLRPFLQRLLDV